MGIPPTETYGHFECSKCRCHSDCNCEKYPRTNLLVHDYIAEGIYREFNVDIFVSHKKEKMDDEDRRERISLTEEEFLKFADGVAKIAAQIRTGIPLEKFKGFGK